MRNNFSNVPFFRRSWFSKTSDYSEFLKFHMPFRHHDFFERLVLLGTPEISIGPTFSDIIFFGMSWCMSLLEYSCSQAGDQFWPQGKFRRPIDALDNMDILDVLDILETSSTSWTSWTSWASWTTRTTWTNYVSYLVIAWPSDFLGAIFSSESSDQNFPGLIRMQFLLILFLIIRYKNPHKK